MDSDSGLRIPPELKLQLPSGTSFVRSQINKECKTESHNDNAQEHPCAQDQFSLAFLGFLLRGGRLTHGLLTHFGDFLLNCNPRLLTVSPYKQVLGVELQLLRLGPQSVQFDCFSLVFCLALE